MLCLVLPVPWVGLQFVIFPGHTHLYFNGYLSSIDWCLMLEIGRVNCGSTTVVPLTSCLLVPSVDNFCKQYLFSDCLKMINVEYGER